MQWQLSDWRLAPTEASDPWKGLVAGAVGGLGGTLVMTGFQYLWSTLAERATNGGEASGDGEHAPTDDVGADVDASAEATDAHREATSETEHEESEPATTRAAQSLSRRLIGRELEGKKKGIASQAMHYGFGVGAGATYGVLVEYAPDVSRGNGTAFGAGLMTLADEVAVPALGFSPPPTEVPASVHIYGLTAHVVYGVTCEWIRREVRKRLG